MEERDMGWDVELKGSVGTLQLDVAFALGAAPVSIIGPNASGKTTLLRMLVGARAPSSGHVQLNERFLWDPTKGVDLPLEARQLAYVPQGYGLFTHLTALENVAFGLNSDLSRQERWDRAQAQLESVGAGDLAHRFPAGLSGGEQQRVALARALVVEPQGLLLDEPLSALDIRSRRSMRSFLVEHLRQSGKPAIVVTHDPRDVIALSGPVIVLEEGRVVQQGSVDELTSEPANEFVAEFFQSPLDATRSSTTER
jgi:ABC-type Fe3+/spermidine/putrescine transport system ATPase subunit